MLCDHLEGWDREGGREGGGWREEKTENRPGEFAFAPSPSIPLQLEQLSSFIRNVRSSLEGGDDSRPTQHHQVNQTCFH